MASPLDSIFTTADVALLHGLTRQRVQQIAAKHGIGTMLRGQRYRLFTREDIERFADVRQTIKHYHRRETMPTIRRTPGSASGADSVLAIMEERAKREAAASNYRRPDGMPPEMTPEFWR
jgi:hypothetical protein